MKIKGWLLTAALLLAPVLSHAVSAPANVTLGQIRQNNTVELAWDDEVNVSQWKIFLDGVLRESPRRNEVGISTTTRVRFQIRVNKEELPTTITLLAIIPGQPQSALSTPVILAKPSGGSGVTYVVNSPGTTLLTASGGGGGAAIAVTIIANTAVNIIGDNSGNSFTSTVNGGLRGLDVAVIAPLPAGTNTIGGAVVIDNFGNSIVSYAGDSGENDSDALHAGTLLGVVSKSFKRRFNGTADDLPLVGLDVVGVGLIDVATLMDPAGNGLIFGDVTADKSGFGSNGLESSAYVRARFNNTPATVPDGSAGLLAMTTNRALHVSIEENNAGAALETTLQELTGTAAAQALETTLQELTGTAAAQALETTLKELTGTVSTAVNQINILAQLTTTAAILAASDTTLASILANQTNGTQLGQIVADDGSTAVHSTTQASTPAIYKNTADAFVAFANATYGARVVLEPVINEFDYIVMRAVTAATGVNLVSYAFLTPSAKKKLTLDCTQCDGDIFFILAETATPTDDTTTAGKHNVLGAGTVRDIEHPGTYIWWWWDIAATVTPSARYNWTSPAMTGNSYD